MPERAAGPNPEPVWPDRQAQPIPGSDAMERRRPWNDEISKRA